MDLDNIILIDKYLEDKMPVEEKEAFRRRLQQDLELREDYELFTREVRRYEFAQNEALQKNIRETNHLLGSKQLYTQRLQRKIRVAKTVTTAGLLILIGSVTMLLFALLVSYFGGK